MSYHAYLYISVVLQSVRWGGKSHFICLTQICSYDCSLNKSGAKLQKKNLFPYQYKDHAMKLKICCVMVNKARGISRSFCRQASSPRCVTQPGMNWLVFGLETGLMRNAKIHIMRLTCSHAVPSRSLYQSHSSEGPMWPACCPISCLLY